MWDMPLRGNPTYALLIVDIDDLIRNNYLSLSPLMNSSTLFLASVSVYCSMGLFMK
jgi:hypothetical protein